jgi:hypothetical protein
MSKPTKQKVSVPRKGVSRKKNGEGGKPSSSKGKQSKESISVKPIDIEDVIVAEFHISPYDENLFERARTQWQFGDWDSLAELGTEQNSVPRLQHHPDRAKLALLAAAGHMQCGSMDQARRYVRLAQDWGCAKQLVNRILIAGVHNSLGRAAAFAGQQSRAVQHLESAVSIGLPGSDVKLLTRVRIRERFNQLSLDEVCHIPNFGNDKALLANSTYSVDSIDKFLPLDEIHQAWQPGRWGSLAKLDNAELVGWSNRADLALYAACGYQQLDDGDGLKRCSRLAVEWGCPKDKVRKYLAAGIRNTLAIADTFAGQYQSAARNFTASLDVENSKPKAQVIEKRIRCQIKGLKGLDVELALEAIVKHLD